MYYLQVIQIFHFERFEMILTLHTFVKEKDLLHNTSKGAKWKGVHKSWIIPLLRAHRKWWTVQGTNVFMLSRCEYLQLCIMLVIKWNIRVRFTCWVDHTLTRRSQTNYGSFWCFFTPINLNTGCLLFLKEVVKIVRNNLVIAQTELPNPSMYGQPATDIDRSKGVDLVLQTQL